MRTRRRTAVLVAGSALAALSGCSAIGLSTSADGSTDAATGATSNSKSWTLVSAGARTPTPGAIAGYSPSPTPTFKLVPLPTASPSGSATGGCSGSQPLGRLAGLDVTPATTSARVTWPDIGDPTLVQYRLTAIAQDIVGGSQADLTWVEVEPTTRCATLTATISGLTSGRPYIFSLDAVLKNYNSDGNRTSTIARSLVVYTS